MVPMILTLTLENLYCTIQLAAYWPLSFLPSWLKALVGLAIFPRVVYLENVSSKRDGEALYPFPVS